MRKMEEDIGACNKNFCHLSILLMDVGNTALRQIFRRRYNSWANCEWDARSETAKKFYKSYIGGRGRPAYDKANEDQKKLLREGDIKKWDLTLLAIVLENTKIYCPENSNHIKVENKYIKELKDVRNSYAHQHGPELLPTEVFNKLWASASSALINLGVSHKKIDQVKNLKFKESTFRQFDLPAPHFTGRADIILKIHEKMKECSKQTSNSSYTERIVILHGLGGIGKSECARMYVQNFIDDPIIRNVAWIDAKNETVLKTDLLSLARRLNILPTANETIQTTVQNIYQHFSEHVGRGLFIFDNAEQMNNRNNGFGIHDFLPTQYLRRPPLVLITSRNIEWEDLPDENKISIPELSTGDGKNYITKSLGLPHEYTTDEDVMGTVQDLVQKLGGHPLALTFAISNIRSKKWRDSRDFQMKIYDYIRRLNDPDSRWIHDELSSGSASRYKLSSMSNVWKETLEKIKSTGMKGEDAIKLLNILAFLPYLPSCMYKISMRNSKFIFNQIFNNKIYKASFCLLEKYSMISIHTIEKSFDREIRIHPVVQLCTRANPELQKELCHPYFLGICKFSGQPRLRFHGMHEIAWMHDYLIQRNWRGNTFQFSVVCISHLLQVEFESLAEPALHEMFTFINHCSIKSATSLSNNVTHLFKLCTFYVKNLANCYNSSWVDSIFSNEELDEACFASMERYIQHLLLTNSERNDPNTVDELARHHTYKLCKTILGKKYSKLSKCLKKRIGESLILSSNESGGSIRTVKELYNLLWTHFLHDFEDRHVCSNQYLEAIVKQHNELYGAEGQNRKSLSENQLKQYWEDGGPIQYNFIMKILKLAKHWANENEHDCKEERAIAIATFVKHGFPQILVQHLTDVCTFSDMISPMAQELLEFITWMTYACNFGHTLLPSANFMDALNAITKKSFEHQHNYPLQISSMLAWFGLFARNSSIEDSTGRKWSIICVSYKMNLLRLKSRPSFNGEWPWQEFVLAHKMILEKYLENHGDNHCSATRTARHLYRSYILNL